jgi:uncharacterized membrane protein YjgN (DUF898 family)
MERGEAAGGALPERFGFEFRGNGAEFFRIWIVNLALSLVTLGVYSAWAKVRTQRYFYGNTYIAGHALDYDASPWRILLGRTIALALFLSYSLSVSIWQRSLPLWYLLFGFALPWLINSSLRFNARNTTYRNIRFNFTGTYVGALVAYILWSILGYATLGILMPQARKERDYFFVNHHAYAGKPFETSFSTLSIYLVYAAGIAVFLVLGVGVGAAFALVPLLRHGLGLAQKSGLAWLMPFGISLYFVFIFTTASTFIDTMSFNLSVNNARLEKQQLRARLSPWVVTWIKITNLALTLATLGIFYPWARVRLARYETTRLALVLASNLEEFTSELDRAQSAVGEEIAGFFDLGIGL